MLLAFASGVTLMLLQTDLQGFGGLPNVLLAVNQICNNVDGVHNDLLGDNVVLPAKFALARPFGQHF